MLSPGVACTSGEASGNSRTANEKAVAAFLDYMKGCDTSNSSDFDGDGKEDELNFDYSGGAHCCYKLSVLLSSDSTPYNFPFDMDGHYTGGIDDSWPRHFNVADYDHDGLPEIFMEIQTYNSEVNDVSFPELGIFSNYIIIEYEKGKLRAKDMGKFEDPWQYFYCSGIRNRGKTLNPVGMKIYESCDSLWGYADENGRMIIAPQYDAVYGFSCRRSYVKNHLGNWQIIDERGKRVKNIPEWWKPYQSINSDFRENLSIVYTDEISDEGTAMEHGYRFVDTTGKMLDGIYYEVRWFYEGLIAVQEKRDGPWGYLDASLKWAIPARYEYAYDFKNDSAYVEIKGKLKWINKRGEMLN
jgi:hypothetical protein